MASAFLMQIVERDSGRVIQGEPGGALEVELIAELGKRLLNAPVGIGTTRVEVAKAAQDALRDVIRELKVRV